MFVRKVGVIAAIMFVSVLGFGQDSLEVKSWKISGVGSVSISQLTLKNWAAGGDESVAGLGLFNVHADYKKDSTLRWDNEFNLNYGLQKVNGSVSRKTDDIFEISSKFGKRATKKWFYSAMLSFKTQLDTGKQGDTLVISSFLAPAYLIASVGIDYKPNKNFTLLLAPITVKATYIHNDSLSNKGVYGVKPGEKLRYEFGGYLKTAYKFTLVKNVDVLFKLNLFLNYLDRPQNVDIENQINVNLKVNKYLSATIKTTLMYDHDVAIANDEGKEVNSLLQFKELIGIAFTYKF